MTWRFWIMVLELSAGIMVFFAPRTMASSFQAVDKDQLAKIETKTHHVSDALEHLQEDIVEELTGVKEKQLFQKADQLLHELTKMEKLLKSNTLTRQDLYKQFDSIDSKEMVLRKAMPEYADKHPILSRDTARIHTLMDDLHFVVSQGDISPERFRQVLTRQAKAMSDVTNKLSRTAGYALGDELGRGELQANLQKLAQASEKFEKTLVTSMDLEKCRKEFTSLNDIWRQVVLGMNLLPPTESVFLLRGASRADSIHERLFELLKINGERPALIIQS